MYGKQTSKPGRKLGHVTATARTVEEAASRATKARSGIELANEENKERPE